MRVVQELGLEGDSAEETAVPRTETVSVVKKLQPVSWGLGFKVEGGQKDEGRKVRGEDHIDPMCHGGSKTLFCGGLRENKQQERRV